MKIEFAEIAYEEFLNTIEYYEIHEPGLGAKFKNEFNQSLLRIEKYPDAWRKETKSTRRYLLKRFPYKIVYFTESERIVIIAVAHSHRKPYYWVDRFKE